MRATDLQLMQLHDGELSEREAARVKAAMLHDPRAAALAGSLEHTGELLRAYAEATSERGAVADDVMRAIRESTLEPIDGPASGTRATRGGRRVGPRRVGPRWAGAVAAVAVAAGVALVFQFSASVKDAGLSASATPTTDQEPPAHGSPATGRVVSEAASIEAVDFGERQGTIFMVSSGTDATTPVVWLADEPDEASVKL